MVNVPFPPLQIPFSHLPIVEQPAEEDAAYTLRSMVLHSGGGLEDGHYICARRRRSDFSEWRLFNDERVDLVDFEGLKQLAAHSTTPYLMFYEKTRPTAEGDENEAPVREETPPSSLH